MEVWILSHHLHLQCRFKLWAGMFAWSAKAKHCWSLSTNFLHSKCFAFTPFLPMFWIFSIKVKVMGSNLGYLLKSFLIYNTCIIKWSVTCCFDWWNLTSISLEITCIYLKIPMHGAKTSPNYRLYWISSSHHTTFMLLQSWCSWIQIIGCGWPKKIVKQKKN